MNTAHDTVAYEGLHNAAQQQPCAFYEPSVASSAPSSQASVFSDAASLSSNQSSVASSVSDDFRLSQEEIQERSCPRIHHQQQQQAKALVEKAQYESTFTNRHAAQLSYAQVTSGSAQHQHPRRNSLARYQRPPPLIRQCDRKINFVDNLVDSATQMVEVIWPLTGPPHCNVQSTHSKGVLPLRTYIEETLRRSRTSYSTLQVALYYLILIKPHVPKQDFTTEQQVDCPANRALQCGRRMFLAALILASKYLQDRNYSAKAWSKMSGLKVHEINTNEKTFLAKVQWKLHIPEPVFRRWSEVVLRYTPNMPPPSPPDCRISVAGITWKSIIPILTPELDRVPMPENKPFRTTLFCSEDYGMTSPTTPTPTKNALALSCPEGQSNETTPTPSTILPRFLEPTPDVAPPMPALARLGPLPTPSMTPFSNASSTPAASACNSRRPSMSCAMAIAHKAGMNRCTLDQYPGALYNPIVRRPSASTLSSRSSPESMLSDLSRSSRASSISSISTVSTNASLAPARASLARQATCRNVGLTSIPGAVKEEMLGSASRPIVVSDDAEMTSSPEMIDFTVNDKAMTAPHRHSKYAPQPVAVPSTEKSRKRVRPRGGRRSNLQEEVRMLLEEELDSMMDVDDDEYEASPSPATDAANRMLAQPVGASFMKQTQPAPTLARHESARVPVQRYDGKKRTCCSSVAGPMSISPSPYYGEVA